MLEARVQQSDFSSMGTKDSNIQCIGWLFGSGLNVLYTTKCLNHFQVSNVNCNKHKIRQQQLRT